MASETSFVETGSHKEGNMTLSSQDDTEYRPGTHPQSVWHPKV